MAKEKVKFNIDDTVYLMQNNRIKVGTIMGIIRTVQSVRYLVERYDQGGTIYLPSLLPADVLFKSRADLLKSL